MTLPCKTCRVTQQVASLIREAAGDLKLEIGLGDRIIDDLQFSSLELMYMIALLEYSMRITIPDSYIKNISGSTTVNDIINLVIKLKANG